MKVHGHETVGFLCTTTHLHIDNWWGAKKKVRQAKRGGFGASAMFITVRLFLFPLL
jgi:hypothetical protein